MSFTQAELLTAIDALRDDFVDYATSGAHHNLAPYCGNKTDECLSDRGECQTGCDACKGFFPAAAILHHEEAEDPVTDDKVLAGAISLMVSAIEDSQQATFEPMTSALIKGYNLDERDSNAETVSALLKYQLDVAYRNALKQIFPESAENRKYLAALECWEHIYRVVGNIVSDVHGHSICCMDCGRWVANQYLKDCLDQTGKYQADMTISEETYWKPDFGTWDQWRTICDGVVSLVKRNRIDKDFFETVAAFSTKEGS